MLFLVALLATARLALLGESLGPGAAAGELGTTEGDIGAGMSFVHTGIKVVVLRKIFQGRFLPMVLGQPNSCEDF